MKNIHILPTDKPSRLQANACFDDVLELWDEIDVPNSIQDKCIHYYHIYITSDEKIKEGDWVYCIVNDMILTDGEKTSRVCLATKTNIDWSYKITLTTDQELINNGVQAIDDEFLEWFVKNSSCEFVDIEKQMLCDYCGQEHCDNLRCRSYKDSPYYEIIVPQEEISNEAKERAKNYMRLKGALNNKQETVEEAAEKLTENAYQNDIWEEDRLKRQGYYQGVIDGAKWQSERMYSEEDLKEAFKQGQKYENFDCQYAFNEWFEQFKKNK